MFDKSFYGPKSLQVNLIRMSNFAEDPREKLSLFVKMLLLIAIFLVLPCVQCSIDKQKLMLKPPESFAHYDSSREKAVNSSRFHDPSQQSTTRSASRLLSNSTNAHPNGEESFVEDADTVRATTRRPINSSEQHQTAIDFVVFKEDASIRQQTNKSFNRLEHHSYNLSSWSESTGGDSSDLIHGNSTSKNLTDPLDVSDSRPRLARYDSQDYSDYSSGYADEMDTANQDASNMIDEASSNMNEKKVVRELTKILSKGMSGATDQVRVETLENLKRRQRERKALKDSRAKLFEEILTTAINNHPERVKKGRGKVKVRAHQAAASSSSSSSPASSLSDTISNHDVDTDLGADAETVLQHLQALAGANYDGGYSSVDAVGPSSESDLSEDSSALSEPSNGPVESVADKPRPIQSQSSDRPIVRQFKRIKNQISQRRKQLDKIKKMFNVELALKDGSLVGKQAPSSSNGPARKRPAKPVADSSDSLDDSSDESDTVASKKSRTSAAPARGDKARELLNYLRDNPEILASVMAELTVDADPTLSGPARTSSTRADLELAYQQQSLDDEENMILGSIKSRRLAPKVTPNYGHNLQMPLDVEDIAGVPTSRRASRPIGQSDRATRTFNEFDSLPNSWRRGRASPQPVQMSGVQMSGVQNWRPPAIAAAPPVRGRPTTEELLLESLRERQLLNLARLDLVLAEKSNRSMGMQNVFSSSGSKSPNHLDPRSINDEHIGYDDARSASASSNRNSSSIRPPSQVNRTDDDLMHHYLATSEPRNIDHIAKQHMANDDYLSSISGQSGLQTQLPSKLNLSHQHQLFDRQLAHQTPSSYNQSHNIGANNLLFNLHHHHQTHNSNPYQPRSTDSYPLLQQQQPLTSLPPTQTTLSRFRDWRDVSQETNSWRQNRASASFNSLSPYDLTTTGSASASSMGVEAYVKVPRLPSHTRNMLANQGHPTPRGDPLSFPVGGGPTNAANPIANEPPKPENNSLVQNVQNLESSGQGAVNTLRPPLRAGTSEPDATSVRVANNDDRDKISKPPTSANRQRASSEDETGSGGRRDDDRRTSHDEEQEDDQDERWERHQMGEPVDYFRSYKEEDMESSNRKRRITKRSSSQRKKKLELYQQPPDGNSGQSEMDDMGAMWA